MNKTRVFLLLLLLQLLLQACTSSPAAERNQMTAEDPLAAFNDFPDSLFNGICWNQPLADARQNLVSLNYGLVDSSGAYTYQNPVDSTRVILPAYSQVRSVKIILRSQEYLQQEQRLLNAFERSATTKQQSPVFSVFEYDLSAVDFKVTVFVQPDFIRLNFEQKMHY